MVDFIFWRYKNPLDINIYLKPHCYKKKKCKNNFKTYDGFFSNFSKKASELSSFIMCKFEVIVTIQLAAQIAYQI